jgi:hypothetical protein
MQKTDALKLIIWSIFRIAYHKDKHSLVYSDVSAGLLTVGVRGSAAGVDLSTEFGDTDPSCPRIWAAISELGKGRAISRPTLGNLCRLD